MELKKILMFILIFSITSSLVIATNHSEEINNDELTTSGSNSGTNEAQISGDSEESNRENQQTFEEDIANLPEELEIQRAAQEEIEEIRTQNQQVDSSVTSNQNINLENSDSVNYMKYIEKLEQDFELMKENQSQTQTTLNYLIIILIVMFLFFISVFSFILMKNKN